jgi:tetratricopeptide (TPR) repeat protein
MKPYLPLAVASVFAAALVAPDIAAAVGDENPTPPAQTTQPSQTKKKSQDKLQDKSQDKSPDSKPKSDKSGSAEDFLRGYHAAYALIYDKHDYVAGIAALRALGYDDNADVATLIGYASRKLGRYDDSKFWYERALAADPNHALTWSYYGMWQVEQGNFAKANDFLEKVRLICGNTECREYRALRDTIDGAITY